MVSNKKWTSLSAAAYYRTKAWGDGFFSVGDDGNLKVTPLKNGIAIDFEQLRQAARRIGLRLPLMVRFLDILRFQLRSLLAAFSSAMRTHSYQGGFTAVYPIKVNQRYSVVDTFASNGDDIGFEAGSKAELLAILACSKVNSIIVCNGYKDTDYIRLALMGQQLGLRVYLVIEKLSELPLIFNVAKRLKLEPLLGVRLRLSTQGKGNWQNTGGESAKFGLSAVQLVELMAILTAENKQYLLRMLHFHMGSQIASLADIRLGLREAMQYYRDLGSAGFSIDTLDMGGGLGVNYDATSSESSCSVSYSFEDYAHCIVETITQCLPKGQSKQPHIITESGRALTAHHVVLLSNVISIESREQLPCLNDSLLESSQFLQRLDEIEVSSASIQINLQSLSNLKERANQAYIDGELSLHQKASFERKSTQLLSEIHGLQQNSSARVDKYFVNYSLFRSTPDVWALNHVFPVMPLSRLHEEPENNASIADLTCDSDGQMSLFQGQTEPGTSIKLHRLKDGEDYLLGFFLLGAYQETLGDNHNLFGETDVVDVELHEGSYRFSHFRQGDSPHQLLKSMRYDSDTLLQRIQEKIAGSSVNDRQAIDILGSFVSCLNSYSYVTDDSSDTGVAN